MALLLIWVIFTIVALATLGGVIQMADKGFNWSDVFVLILFIIILVVFGTIGVTGGFTL